MKETIQKSFILCAVNAATRITCAWQMQHKEGLYLMRHIFVAKILKVRRRSSLSRDSSVFNNGTLGVVLEYNAVVW